MSATPSLSVSTSQRKSPADPARRRPACRSRRLASSCVRIVQSGEVAGEDVVAGEAQRVDDVAVGVVEVRADRRGSCRWCRRRRCPRAQVPISGRLSTVNRATKSPPGRRRRWGTAGPPAARWRWSRRPGRCPPDRRAIGDGQREAIVGQGAPDVVRRVEDAVAPASTKTRMIVPSAGSPSTTGSESKIHSTSDRDHAVGVADHLVVARLARQCPSHNAS